MVLLCSALTDPSFAAGAPGIRRTWTHCSPEKGHENGWGLEHLSLKTGRENLGCLSLEKKEDSRDTLKQSSYNSI